MISPKTSINYGKLEDMIVYLDSCQYLWDFRRLSGG